MILSLSLSDNVIPLLFVRPLFLFLTLLCHYSVSVSLFFDFGLEVFRFFLLIITILIIV